MSGPVSLFFETFPERAAETEAWIQAVVDEDEAEEAEAKATFVRPAQGALTND